jgi:hypothetical protein
MIKYLFLNRLNRVFNVEFEGQRVLAQGLNYNVYRSFNNTQRAVNLNFIVLKGAFRLKDFTIVDQWDLFQKLKILSQSFDLVSFFNLKWENLAREQLYEDLH